MNIYISSPIDFVSEKNQCIELLKFVEETFKYFGHNVFIPANVWLNSDECIQFKHRRNWQMLKESDVFVCMLNGNTIGCLIELGYAISANKNVLVIYSDGCDTDSIQYSRSTTLTQIPQIFKNVQVVSSHDISPTVIAHLTDVKNIQSKTPKQLSFVKIGPDAVIPRKAITGDAGMDLYAAENVTIEPNRWYDISTQIIANIPEGFWLRITGRSSTFRRLGLHVIEGIIDQGYRGELKIGVFNMANDKPIVIKKGDRVAQTIIHRLYEMETCEVQEVEDTARGSAGFGSTGA